MIDDERLSAYLDDELDAVERAAMEAELDGSAELRAELAAVGSVRDQVRALPPVEPPFGFFHNLVRARRRRWPIAAAAAAVSAAAVILALVITSGGAALPRVVPQVDQLVALHSSPATAGIGGDVFAPMEPDEVDAALMPPAALEPGMARAGLWQGGEVLASQFSDGVHVVSAFQQIGEVDFSGLPEGEMTMMADEPAWHGEIDGMSVVVATRGDSVVTMVADPDMDDHMDDMIAAMPAPER